MKEYPYRKMNEMREILEVLQMPSKLKNTRTILTLLAVARVKEKSKWSQVEESYARTHDMIVFMNEYYPNKGGTDLKRGGYSENSRETIRDDSVSPLCSMAVMEHNGAKSQSEKSSYRLTKEFATLLRAYGTENWEEELCYYCETHQTYEEKYSQIRQVDKGLSVLYNGEQFHLKRSAHNKLQAAILEEFVPIFVPGAKLLYIGDTKKRELVKDVEFLNELNITVLEHAMLPDLILYQEENKWLLFIEAYTSTGELTIERVSKIKEYCKDCPKDIEIIFVTAFQTMKKCQQKFLSIAWDTEIWVAEEPTHMIHKNGNKFLDAHSNTISKNK